MFVTHIYDRSPERYRDALVAAGWPGRVVCLRKPEEITPHLPEIEVLLAWGIPGELLGQMPRLRWVQWLGAGVDRAVPWVPNWVTLTRVEGPFSAMMAEHAMAYILAIRHRLFERRDAQMKHEWERILARPISGGRLGVAGLGQIGGAIARLGRALGMEVWGMSRTGRGAEFVDRHFRPEERLEFVSGVDALVLVLPKTNETDGLFGRREFGTMREGAILVNIGRGNAIDEEALLDGLRAGRPAFAQLDVFHEEPLPRSHPFWVQPNCIVTAHCSGPSELTGVDFAIENLVRYREGRPLLGVVERERGY